ncbi:MAG: DUF2309 domain-containing protein [Nitrospirota bacterium]
MNPLEVEARPRYQETQRTELRTLVRIASEMVAQYWPMRTFVHHNPLHGLEELHFEEAARRARQALGGMTYLPNEVFRDYVRTGRIRSDEIDDALKPLAQDHQVALGDRKLTHLDVLRAHLLHGMSAPPDDVLDAMIERRKDRRAILALADRLGREAPRAIEEARAQAELAAIGRSITLAAWCDRALGTQVTEQINREMIKWCEAFLDEEHAAWSMPGRDMGFYSAWKWLASLEWSPCGIARSRRKLADLPDNAEEALLDHLAVLGVSPDAWQDYLASHFVAMPGWPGFIKWRADQTDYEWQQAYPIDLIQYLAVRVWYERELVQQVCRRELGGDGTVEAIRAAATSKAARAAESPDTLRRTAAWRLLALAHALDVAPPALMDTEPAILQTLVDWLDAFPEAAHGPVWLRAFEAGYRDRLLEQLRPQVVQSPKATAVRPQAQAVFCIDVRSEPFRRHLEAVGDFGTFGFAGFFIVFIRYQTMGGHHETDQFPVIMKAKNSVREVPRIYQSQLLSRHRTGTKLVHTAHTLLHDLKENVVTPYVMVESLGWFYSLPLIGKTVLATWYQRAAARLRRVLVPHISTAMTVDKLSREEVTEMLAAEQRGVIRRALQERFGDRDLNLSLERLEYLRKRALEEPSDDQHPPKGALTTDEETAFIDVLREQYRINQGGAFSRMERITRMGFTPSEQAFTVETALRMMGLTENFARLVLFCGHRSTSDNNPFEAALDCGACGGNTGKPNARVVAAMANKAQVRHALAKNGLIIPQDTYFIAGQHDTTTDTVELFDLEDIPHTHMSDLDRLLRGLEKAGRRTSRERCGRFPELPPDLSLSKAVRETSRRSGDWSQVRPEWGLSGNAAFVIGRRELTHGVDLAGRAFLHSYDYRGDANGRLLEIVMTGPQVVGQWINMEHYFSTVDPEVFGAGSKIYHNVVGRFGVMSGPQSDLRTGLAWQTVMDGPRPYHEAMRLLTLIEAPRNLILQIVQRHRVLRNLYDNEWVRLVALDPEEGSFFYYLPKQGWTPVSDGRHSDTTL